MKVWTTLTEREIYAIAREVGVSISERGTVFNEGAPLMKVGRAYSFGLRPRTELGKRDGDYKYQRVSASPWGNSRRVHAVCWHGHRDFMSALFDADPEARIKTMWADYKSWEDFLDLYPGTAWQNVGSLMYPQSASEVCNCWKGEWDNV